MANFAHTCTNSFNSKPRCFLKLLLLSALSLFIVHIFGLMAFYRESNMSILLGRNLSKQLENMTMVENTIKVSKCVQNEDYEVLKAIRSSKGMWTISPAGRFGNQMGQYATLFALARLNRKQAYMCPRMANYLPQNFKITLPTLTQEVVAKIPWKNYYLSDWMEEKHKKISGDYIKFSGYPVSWTFYHHIREEISREFSFHEFIANEINLYLWNITAERQNVTYIGVHVRRGDYVHVMPNTWKGVIGDKSYLEQAMSYFRNKYKNALFIVVSNGIEWCRKNIDASKGDVYFSGDGNEAKPQKDFAILAHCNHTIMTIGTFGFWAAYLAGGEVIYLSNFTLPNSPFLKVFKYEASFRPEWIGIAADLTPLLVKTP
ncbi:galactoside alpha-(1,2)-fucosyltransferase 2-like [Rhinoraja longicauda]